MPDATQRTPQPLDADECKEGIAERMKREFMASLNKTCSLNRRSFSAIRAKWWVEYELDDFGRVERGGIGGSIGEVSADAVRIEGSIEPMPPDRFRRETSQPIPKPTIAVAKDENTLGVTRSVRGGRKGKDA